MSDMSNLAERVARACRVLARLDLTKAATGHVSARVPGAERILIRARGPAELGVRYTGIEQIVECDFDGKIVGSSGTGLAAPLEVFIHTEVYKARPEVFSVIHMHPPTPMLFTICRKPLLPLYGAYDPSSARLAIDGIPLFDRSILINNAALGAQLAKTMGGSKTCMMRGHGITTAGPSVEQAALYAIRTERARHDQLPGAAVGRSAADLRRRSRGHARIAFAGIIPHEWRAAHGRRSRGVAVFLSL